MMLLASYEISSWAGDARDRYAIVAMQLEGKREETSRESESAKSKEGYDHRAKPWF